MRRKDREVADFNEIIKIIRECEVCYLGLCAQNIPYVVPLNFGLEIENGKAILYFHCAKEGKKLDIIRENPNACFSMDAQHSVVPKEKAEEYTTLYKSASGLGYIEILNDIEEKRAGLLAIMSHNAPGISFDLPDAVIGRVEVLRLAADEITGKSNHGQ